MSYVSHADLGGRVGFGSVVPEPEGDHFHANWEPRALALTLAMGATGAWNIDMSRSARETLPGYLALSYYEVWIHGLCRLMAERGIVVPDELSAGRPLGDPVALPRRLEAAAVGEALARGSPTERPSVLAPRFSIGQRVRTHDAAADHHTRLPGYARGKHGIVVRAHGTHVFADTNAQGLGEQPRWLYGIAFDGRELWGADAAPGLTVTVDAWDSYLDSA